MKKRKKYSSLREVQTKVWGMFADFGACSQCGDTVVESPEEGKGKS